MTKTSTREWTLWGQTPITWKCDPMLPIRIDGGSLGHCRQELAFRKRQGGWWHLVIMPAGQAPVALPRTDETRPV